jgi:hypothetical protein
MEIMIGRVRKASRQSPSAERDDPVLSAFEDAMDHAYNGEAPGSDWWLGRDPVGFVRVARELLPFMYMRNPMPDGRVMNPAQEILQFCGHDAYLGRGKGVNEYDPNVVHHEEEQRRLVSFGGLARLMRRQGTVPMRNQYWVSLTAADPVGALFVSNLTPRNEELLMDMAQRWPAEARDRMQGAIALLGFPLI